MIATDNSFAEAKISFDSDDDDYAALKSSLDARPVKATWNHFVKFGKLSAPLMLSFLMMNI